MVYENTDIPIIGGYAEYICRSFVKLVIYGKI